MTDWEQIFHSSVVPKWLHDFEEAPLSALDTALWGNYYFGNLDVVDPADLIIDWALGAGLESDFTRNLDQALAEWVGRYWGKLSVKTKASSALTTVAWVRLTDIVTNTESLHIAASALRSHFEQRNDYLGLLCDGPSRDPLGGYLKAVARHQNDHSLLPTWWNYCDLIQGVHWFHGINGILGLRGMPPLNEDERGGFPEYVVAGLARLAVGLLKRSLERSISLTEARSELERVSGLTRAAYPFPDLWQKYWQMQLENLDEQIRIRSDIPHNAVAWISEVLHPVPAGNRSRNRSIPDDFTSWKTAAVQLGEQLRRNLHEALPAVERHLNRQRQHAERTGDSNPLCWSLTVFAKATPTRHANYAVHWAQEARLWEPWNGYSWGVLINAMRRDRNSDVKTVLTYAWEALERFPDDVVIWTELARTLIEADEASEAEQIYREILERFPQDAVARTQLTEMLRRTGRIQEAQRIDLETMDRFPQDPFVHSTLVETLVKAKRFNEAEEILRQASDRFPENPVLLSHLADVLIATNRLSDAERVYRSALENFPNDIILITGLVSLLRKLHRNLTDEGLNLVKKALSLDENDAVAWLEKAHILEGLGQMEEANEAHALAAKYSSASSTVRRETKAEETEQLEEEELGDKKDYKDGTFPLATEPETSEPTSLTKLVKGEERVDLEPQRLQTGSQVGEPQQPTQPVDRAQSVELETPPLQTKSQDEERQEPKRPLEHDLVASTETKKEEVKRPTKARGKQRSSISRSEAIAMNAHARFLRRWARYNERGRKTPAPHELRDHAAAILRRLIDSQPNNPRPITEMGLLHLEAKEYEKAETLLTESIPRFSTHIGLRYALARVQRETARLEARRLDYSRLDSVTAEWNQIGQLDPEFQPLEYLGKGRAWLAHTDGEYIEKYALRSFNSVREWMKLHLQAKSPTQSPRTLREPQSNDPVEIKGFYVPKRGFNNWWSLEVQAYLFGPIDISVNLEREHLETISNRLDLYSLPIDSLEEDYALRVTL